MNTRTQNAKLRLPGHAGLLLLAVLCLFLSGCRNAGSAAQEPILFAVQADIPLADGLDCFEIQGTDCRLFAMGDHLLIFRAGPEETELIQLESDSLAVTAQTVIPIPWFLQDPSIRVYEDGISFYSWADSETVVLDAQLQEIRRISMPEVCQGRPILSRDGQKLYYCTADAVMAMDCIDGSTRCLRKMPAQPMSITGLYLEDRILECSVYPMEEEEECWYFQAEDGLSRCETGQPLTAASWGTEYAAEIRCGKNRVIYSGVGDQAQSLLLLPQGMRTLSFLNSKTAAAWMDNGIFCFDLDSGIRTAEIRLPDGCQVNQAVQIADGSIWFLLNDDTHTILAQWHSDQTPSMDKSCRRADYQSPDDPDTEALARCRAEAERLSEQFGIEILIDQEAAQVHPWDYVFTPEYLVPVIEEELTLLEKRLASLPEGFLNTMTANADRTHIAIVRRITGTADSPEDAAGLQFWYGSDSYLIIAAGAGSDAALYHELCHMIDTQVLNTSPAYDTWNELNPSDFTYDYDYAANRNRDGSKYMEPGLEHFVDVYSMSFPKEDRARILECAMTDGNETLFESVFLQQKLERICRGIRTGFQLEDYPEKLPWERYLRRSLIPK